VTQQAPQSGERAWDALRRRKVVQWGLGYVAVAWGIVQALEFAVATFHWAEAITRVGAVLAVAGLPVTITLAWFHGDRGHQRATRLELVVLAAVLAVGGVVARQVAISPPATGSIATSAAARPAERSNPAPDRRRIAVLPFENFGNDPANASFASGVHDTLITQVSKVPGLAVISRSSVLQYEGQHPTIREVADALHVGTVLEGSVARDGGRLRIQAQLIDAATDEHLWAETYDRKADDLFAVQSEIAQAVAEQLRIRLASGDAERLRANLTRVPVAYEHYVLGRSHASKGAWGDAIAEFTQAVTLDPDFAAAHAQLSMAHVWLGFDVPARRAESMPAARREVARALALDPTLPEAHLAQAVYFYRGEQDIERAAQEFELAIRGLPNDAAAYRTFGFLRRWQGRFEEGTALLKRAAELDPGGHAVSNAALGLAGLGRRKEALELIEAGMAARPQDAALALMPGIFAGDIDCDLASEEASIESVRARFPDDPQVLGETWFFALTTGDAAGAVAAAERYAALADPDDDSGDWRLALAQQAAGQQAEARKHLRRSVARYISRAEDMPRGDQIADQFSWIALHYSLMGDRAKAIEYARRSVANLPPGGGMFQRARLLYFDALALALAGDIAAAAPLLRQSLSIPFPHSAKGMWCDPLAAPLRGNPEYRALMSELGADVSIDPARRETWPTPTSIH
jgi:TolB-like protein